MIPIALDVAESAAECRAPGNACAPARHFLVVDDNSIYCRLVSALLESFGMSCVTAESGEDALAIAAEFPFDAALMDMHMPGMDGLETARRLRRIPAWSDRPVLALTADKPAPDDPRLAEARLDGVIMKPIHAEDFHEALVTMLDG